MASIPKFTKISERVDEIDESLARVPVVGEYLSFFYEVTDRYLEIGGSTLSAAVSYYIFLSLFPILILTISILGYVTQDYGPAYDSIMGLFSQVMPGYTHLVERNFDAIISNASELGFVAFAGLLWVSMGVFSSIEFSLNTVFEVKEYQSVLRTGLLGLSGVFLLACLILVSTLTTPVKGVLVVVLSVLPLMDQQNAALIVGFVLTFMPFLVSFLLFFTLYRFIPARRVGEKEVVAGAVVASVTWELAKNVLFWYLTARMGYYELVYGSLVLIIVTILWSYIFSLILVYVGCMVYELDKKFNK